MGSPHAPDSMHKAFWLDARVGRLNSWWVRGSARLLTQVWLAASRRRIGVSLQSYLQEGG